MPPASGLPESAAEGSAAPNSIGGPAALLTSSRTIATGSKLVSIFAWSLIAWNSFLTLSRSASRSTSRMASMNWPWNSAAIRRILPTVWPTVRMTRGRSFGGITAKATTPTMIILLMSRSNMAHRTARPLSGAAGATPSSQALRFKNAFSRPCERRWRRRRRGSRSSARRSERASPRRRRRGPS